MNILRSSTLECNWMIVEHDALDKQASGYVYLHFYSLFNKYLVNISYSLNLH